MDTLKQLPLYFRFRSLSRDQMLPRGLAGWRGVLILPLEVLIRNYRQLYRRKWNMACTTALPFAVNLVNNKGSHLEDTLR